MRQDGEHGTTRGTLDPPDGDATQAHAEIMRVARQASAPATGGLVCELKAEGQEEGENEFDKGLAITKQLKVGRFVLKIDGDSAIVSRRFGRCVHVSPQVVRFRKRMRHDGSNTLRSQDHREELKALPLN